MADLISYFTEIFDGLVLFWGAIPGWWAWFLDMMHTVFLVVGAFIVFVIYVKLSGGGGVGTVDHYISKD